MTIVDIIEKWDGIFFSMYNYAISMYTYLRHPSLKKIVKRNVCLKNKHKGKRCFIVLNGPSINSLDLNVLKNEYVFGSNFFFRSPICKIVNPDYYCWLDPTMFFEEDANNVMYELLTACPNASILLNSKAYSVFGQNERIFYLFNKHISNIFGTKYNLAGISSNFMTVAYMAIISAFYMGFNEIYILGLDFEPTGFKHFSNLGANSECVKPVEKSSKLDVAGHFWGYTLAQYQAYYLAKLSKKIGCNIYNCNNNSYIRAFDFKSFDKIF